MESGLVIDELRKIIAPVTEEAGLELVDLMLSKSRFRPALRILVDRKDGGITVGECTLLNRKIGDLLDTQDILSAGYVLEVCSPGVDRPLTAPNDFVRCLNRRARFFLNEPVNGKIEWVGIIVAMEGESVTVDCQGTTLAIPLLLIRKARQEY